MAREVFELFPYAILVTERDGRIIRENAALQALAGHGAADVHTCCELLGCRQPGTALEDGCVTELALQAGTAIAELRIDLPGGANAAWVTAAPVGDDGRVAIQLRPGRLGDRRRRAEPHWIAGRAPRIRCLGQLRVETTQGPVEGDWVRQRAGQVLGYLLVNRGRSVPAEELAEALWPDSGPAAIATVRHFIHVLRTSLEPHRTKRGESSFVVARGGGYEIDRRRVSIDAEEFSDRATAALAAHAEAADDAAAQLRAALELYGGDLLSDHPYADWALTERDRLHRLATQSLRVLARLELDTDDLDAAGGHLQWLSDLEPLDLESQRELIRISLRKQRHSEAQRRYSALRKRMMRSFGQNPDFSLAELAASVDPDTVVASSASGR